MKAASIAVVIPAHDAERHLGRALRSVLSQSLPPSQIIVVDDGSTDGTEAVARRFGPGVECIRQSNAGAAAARNTGIARAEAELVALLDADDEWLPNHLAQSVEVFREQPGIAWYSAAYLKEEPDGAISRSRPDPALLVGHRFADFFEAASGGWTNYTPTMVVRRAVLCEVGGFSPSLPTAEDLDLWFRIALEHPCIGYGPDPSVLIHHTPGSLTTRGLFTRERAEQLADRWEALQAASERRDDPAPRRYLARRIVDSTLRPALVSGDRDAVRWVVSRFGTDLPPRWRTLATVMLYVPAVPWSAAAALWARSRAARAALGR